MNGHTGSQAISYITVVLRMSHLKSGGHGPRINDVHHTHVQPLAFCDRRAPAVVGDDPSRGPLMTSQKLRGSRNGDNPYFESLVSKPRDSKTGWLRGIFSWGALVSWL